MDTQALYFTKPGRVEISREQLPALTEGKVVVKAQLSAISPGTEMLFYRGQIPDEMQVDNNLAGMDHPVAYPLKYGYSMVGEVVELGPQVDSFWLGKRVFAFLPHKNYFLATCSELIVLPEDISNEDAVFLPNMETAVNLVMDGAPLLGEQVAVFGQGIVGLLTTALLARFPLVKLITFDNYLRRREASEQIGGVSSLDTSNPEALAIARMQLNIHQETDGVDLAFELSGVPAALNQAIAFTAYNGRIIIGSWYGTKPAALNLGGRFHRSRIRLISSQVSSLSPQLSGRWDKARRFATAWEMIRQVRPSKWITQRLPFEQAGQAYRLLDETPQETIQIVMVY
jgi:2-desacetyl-2-hydroxyethyl bacteriochlorophyllide A dehydrogenase